MTLESNFPKNMNGVFVRMSSDNAKETERRLLDIKQYIDKHKLTDEKVHDSSQIVYENTTVDKELKILRNQVQSQVVGKNGD